MDGRAARRRAGRHAQDEGPRFLRTGLRSIPGGPKVARQVQRSAGRLNQTLGQRHCRTRPKPGIHEAGNDCDASKLDFRVDEATDEGCVDAMSTESSCSIAAGSMRLKPATGVATRKRLEFGAIPESGIQSLVWIPVARNHRRGARMLSVAGLS